MRKRKGGQVGVYAGLRLKWLKRDSGPVQMQTLWGSSLLLGQDVSEMRCPRVPYLIKQNPTDALMEEGALFFLPSSC